MRALFVKSFLKKICSKFQADGQITVWKTDLVSYTEKPLPGTGWDLHQLSSLPPAAHTAGLVQTVLRASPRPDLPGLLGFLAPPLGSEAKVREARDLARAGDTETLLEKTLPTGSHKPGIQHITNTPAPTGATVLLSQVHFHVSG